RPKADIAHDRSVFSSGTLSEREKVTGRAFDRKISPIKSGPQPIVTAQGRIRGRMPIVPPLSAIGRSHLGNPCLLDKRPADVC
ncbi:MAG: hypothetical protein O6944_05150, partial [Gammaproteobacteria bacterium]|nr:hypothetical protein [Gammaproteobacteria bacterium]